MPPVSLPWTNNESSTSTDFSVSFDSDHSPVLDINSGSTARSGPLAALVSNTGLHTDLGPPLAINDMPMVSLACA
ncbi:hypothetical protein EVAR_93938_1 [Eumeta japonica]|uniref:Uncharacterized protein n=1 Tax=Eumeta variegata TaxID=151549 RepID=A0A4C1TP49_EUMVA|nr:hypothetical protein EVAR_93938_1 [Eumeta japonica]